MDEKGYVRHHHIMQIGRRWHVATEIQVVLTDGSDKWFTDQEAKKLFNELCVPLQERFSSNSRNNLEIIQSADMLITYKFEHHEKHQKKDIVLTGLPVQVLKPGSRQEHKLFRPCYLRNEKLIITVSKRQGVKQHSNEQALKNEQAKSEFFKKRKEEGNEDDDNFSSTVSDASVGGQTDFENDVSFRTKISKFKRQKKGKIYSSGNENIEIHSDNHATVPTTEVKRSRTSSRTTRGQKNTLSGTENTPQQKHQTATEEKGKNAVLRKESVQKRVTRECKKPKVGNSTNNVNDDADTINNEQSENVSRNKTTTAHSDRTINEKVAGKQKKTKSDNSKQVDLETTEKQKVEKSKTSRKKQTSSQTLKKKLDESILELAVEDNKTLDKNNGNYKNGLENVDTVSKPGKRKITSLSSDNSDDDFNKPAFKTKKVTNKKKGNKLRPAKSYTLEELVKNKKREEEIGTIDEIERLQDCNETVDLEEYGNVSFEDISDVSCLTPIQLRDIVRNMEKELRGIFSGKVFCDRHEEYKKGGRHREYLKMQVSFGPFNEEQEEAVTRTLREIFCKRRSTYFDYVMNVLLPETLLTIYQKAADCSREEAQRVFDQ